jgi:hypothetical protein
VSKDEDKIKHSKRLLKDNNAIAKQVKIAKEHGIPVIDEHRFNKHHAMDCGNPDCVMCGNPRKVWGERTVQEQRFDQQYKSDQKSTDNDDAND